MKKALFKVALAAVVFSSLTFTACKKESEVQPEETAVEDNNAAMIESEDLVSISDEVMLQNSASLRVSEEGKSYYGATVTITQKGQNATGAVVVDFGTGTKGRDGRTRKGKVIITYTNVAPVNNAKREFSFDNYYVNNNKVEGTKTVTFTNEPSNGIYTASINSNLTITTSAGKTLAWTSTRTRTYNTNNTPLDLSDDSVSLSGTANGTNRNGEEYTAVITTPLVIKATCLSTSGWLPSSGVLEVTPETGVKRVVNYGSGDCDRTVNVTVGTRSFDVTIK